MRKMPDCRSYFSSLSQTIERLPFVDIDGVVDVLMDAYENARMIFLFGNGGSAALASHLACDLGKGTVNGSGKRFRVLSLTDNVPLMTAWANDVHYEDIFAQQLENYVRPRDVAFAISGSGNSPNVLRAIEYANQAGCRTMALTGRDGGRLGPMAQLNIQVSVPHMGRIEDAHMIVCHMIGYYFMDMDGKA